MHSEKSSETNDGFELLLNVLLHTHVVDVFVADVISTPPTLSFTQLEAGLDRRATTPATAAAVARAVEGLRRRHEHADVTSARRRRVEDDEAEVEVGAAGVEVRAFVGSATARRV